MGPSPRGGEYGNGLLPLSDVRKSRMVARQLRARSRFRCGHEEAGTGPRRDRSRLAVPFLRREGKLLMYHGWDDTRDPAGEFASLIRPGLRRPSAKICRECSVVHAAGRSQLRPGERGLTKWIVPPPSTEEGGPKAASNA